MNRAFAEEQKAMSGLDTSSRHLLGQREDVTAAPWKVAQAGHKVRLLKLAWRNICEASIVHDVTTQSCMLTHACLVQTDCVSLKASRHATDCAECVILLCSSLQSTYV